MTADKTKLSSLTTRQKVIGGAFVLIAVFIVWQIKGMFGGGASTASVQRTPASRSPTMARSTTPGANPSMTTAGSPATSDAAQQSTPQQVAHVEGQPPLSQREMELIQLQQDTEAKYIAALNELQLLKINQSIAETNKAIATAKLDMVTAQKGVVDLLTTPIVSQASYSQSLSGTPQAATSTTTQTQTTVMATQQQEKYTVISVSQLQYKWNAVIGDKGNLYSVTIGDRLPTDDSKVVSIDKSGVVLEKDGQKRKLSLVPII